MYASYYVILHVQNYRHGVGWPPKYEHYLLDKQRKQIV